jgi:hypothetical protein
MYFCQMRLLLGIAILSLLLQSFGRTVILINFKINQAYIAANLCESKDIPDSSCEGNCQLKKQIEQTEQSAQRLPPSYDFKELVLFAKPATKRFLTNPFSYPFKAFSPQCHAQISRGFLLTVFHPPDQD